MSPKAFQVWPYEALVPPLIASSAIDYLSEEVPIALVLNGISYAVMLASPRDLEDFALGFACSEGLLEGPSECYGIETITRDNTGIELQLEVSARAEHALKARRRSLAGRTGCGLCGVESLKQVHRDALRPPLTRDGNQGKACTISADAIASALQTIPALQTEQNQTGAVHAAAWCSRQGEVLWLREDVGRHNALDKVLGAGLRQGPGAVDWSSGWLLVTSRASFEMVQKAAMLGITMLVAVSAPTAKAVRSAQTYNLALAGFARQGRFVAYTQPERFGLAVNCRAAPPTEDGQRPPNPSPSP